MLRIEIKRAYLKPEGQDGFRCLVDRLWPRGLSREMLRLDAWYKELAPSGELRRWFTHDPGKWPGFKRRYFSELDDQSEVVAELLSRAQQGRLTLVYAAKDEQYNNAVALKEYLEAKLAN